MKERAILHCDANCFYASVETVLNPALRGKAVAVCGSTEERHGIVLAKSELAKKAGVKTGAATWQAKECCPNLIVVPPQYEYYVLFSKHLFRIYQRYTDQVEPFGMDECWLDVTNTPRPPMEIAEEIRQAVKDELGLTISIGVSFCKVFAKLGSDMKKPDAITEITRENFREKVWSLPCADLFFCGRATTEKLRRMCIKTIGRLAKLPLELVQGRFGKNGLTLWRYANGLDDSRVANENYRAPAKSVGHGITCQADLHNEEEAYKVIIALSQDIGYKLRLMNLRATGVSLVVVDNKFSGQCWQESLFVPTQDEAEIASVAYQILKKQYVWRNSIRKLTVTAINLESAELPTQLLLFFDHEKAEKKHRLNLSVDSIRNRHGKRSILPAVIMDETQVAMYAERELTMPGHMYE